LTTIEMDFKPVPMVVSTSFLFNFNSDVCSSRIEEQSNSSSKRANRLCCGLQSSGNDTGDSIWFQWSYWRRIRVLSSNYIRTIHISRPLHVKNKTTISQALMLDRMDLRTAQLNNRSPPAPAFYYLPCEEILHFRSSRYSYAFLVLF
jgi:hypothetical protein